MSVTYRTRLKRGAAGMCHNRSGPIHWPHGRYRRDGPVDTMVRPRVVEKYPVTLCHETIRVGAEREAVENDVQ